MKIYQIIFQDEYNNLYLIGFYKNLKDSIRDINEELDSYGAVIEEEDLKLYPSSFSECFDLSIKNMDRYENNDEIPDIYVRGFVLEVDTSLDELLEL